MNTKLLLTVASLILAFGPRSVAAQTVDLPTSKQLIGEIPGHPQRLNSLPMSMAVSPGGRYVVTVNAGYGTFESKYQQSLAVLDTGTGALVDFPDGRTLVNAKQTLYSLASPSAATASTFTPAWARSPTLKATASNRQRHRGLPLYRWQDRARPLHPAAVAATRRRPEDDAERRCAGRQGCALPVGSRRGWLCRPRARKAAGWPTKLSSLMMCCSSTRPAA